MIKSFALKKLEAESRIFKAESAQKADLDFMNGTQLTTDGVSKERQDCKVFRWQHHGADFPRVSYHERWLSP